MLNRFLKGKSNGYACVCVCPTVGVYSLYSVTEFVEVAPKVIENLCWPSRTLLSQHLPSF
jgi:hypothetical protein